MAELLELIPDVVVHGELGAALHQVPQTGPVGGQRRPLVEGDLVDPHPVPEVGEKADQRLSDRARAHDMDNPLHAFPLEGKSWVFLAARVKRSSWTAWRLARAVPKKR